MFGETGYGQYHCILIRAGPYLLFSNYLTGPYQDSE